MLAGQRKMGRYRVIKEIGSGGLGRVFKGIDENTGEPVAIKVLHRKFLNQPRFLGIFHRELMIASTLKHKNLVGYITSHFDPPDCYIVSQFVSGGSLHSLLKVQSRVPPLVALCMAVEILQGIDYLHLHDTVHADLSSPNVLVSKNGRILITDFGLAGPLEIENYKNYMIGTPGFYSPEHISERGISVPSDLYCVGLLLYQMLAGTKAVPAEKDRASIERNMKRVSLKPILCADRKMQSMVRKILNKALQFKERKRYQLAEHMMLDIVRVLKRYNIRYSRPIIKQYLKDINWSPHVTIEQRFDIYYGFYHPPRQQISRQD